MPMLSRSQKPNLFKLWLLFSVPWSAFFAYQAWVTQAEKAAFQQYVYQWTNTAGQARSEQSEADQLQNPTKAKAVFQEDYELAQEMIAMNSKVRDENAKMFNQSLKALLLPLILLIPVFVKE